MTAGTTARPWVSRRHAPGGLPAARTTDVRPSAATVRYARTRMLAAGVRENAGDDAAPRASRRHASCERSSVNSGCRMRPGRQQVQQVPLRNEPNVVVRRRQSREVRQRIGSVGESHLHATHVSVRQLLQPLAELELVEQVEGRRMHGVAAEVARGSRRASRARQPGCRDARGAVRASGPPGRRPQCRRPCGSRRRPFETPCSDSSCQGRGRQSTSSIRGYSGRHIASWTCWIRSCSSTCGQALLGRGRRDRERHRRGDRPQVRHRRQQGGTRAAGVGHGRATASAAAAIIRSLIRVALATMTPSPRPGKTRALFAWAIS